MDFSFKSNLEIIGRTPQRENKKDYSHSAGNAEKNAITFIAEG